MPRRVLTTVSCLGLLTTSGGALAQSCTPGPVPHRIPPLGGKVYAMVEFDDDGDGAPSLIAGGDTLSFGGQSIGTIAKLVGEQWVRLGSGHSGLVRAMTVHSSGSGDRLYASGGAQVFRLDSATWTPLGTGTPQGLIQSMAWYDDGTGETIYIGGMFSRVLRLNSDNWQVVGPQSSHTATRVQGLAVLDPDGSGPDRGALYAAGSGTYVGSTPTFLMKWDGTSWTASSPTTGGFWIKSLIAHHNGIEPQVVATTHPSGSSTSSPFVFNSQVAGWNGSAWTQYTSPSTMMGPLYAMISFPDHAGEPSTIWGHDGSSAYRYSGTSFARQFSTSVIGADYSAITPARVASIGTGPAAFVMQVSGSQFVKIAACPRLESDFDLDGSATIADVLDFLTFWFSGSAFGDFDGNGQLRPADIFAFLNAWFAGI